MTTETAKDEVLEAIQMFSIGRLKEVRMENREWVEKNLSEEDASWLLATACYDPHVINSATSYGKNSLELVAEGVDLMRLGVLKRGRPVRSRDSETAETALEEPESSVQLNAEAVVIAGQEAGKTRSA